MRNPGALVRLSLAWGLCAAAALVPAAWPAAAQETPTREDPAQQTQEGEPEVPAQAAPAPAAPAPEQPEQPVPHQDAVQGSLPAEAGFLEDAPREGSTHEDWYAVTLNGQPAGWMVSREREAAGELSTETQTHLSLSRGGVGLKIEVAGRFIETLDGEPLSMWSRQSTGTVPVEVTYRFREDHLELTKTQANRVSESELPLPDGEWLTPGEVSRLTTRKIAAGAERLTYRTLDPSLGPMPVEVTTERTGEELSIEVAGTPVAATGWRQTQSLMPGVDSVLYLDGEGRLVRSVTSLLGMEVIFTLTDRETALASQGSPELLPSTFVKPDRPIPSPRSLHRGVYELSVPGSSLPPALPAAGAQRVERIGDKARITVTVGEAQPAGEVDPAPYLASSAFLDHDAPAVEKLATEALEDAPEAAAARAESLRAFVHGYLTAKDLGTGFGSASEVAASRSGDCTEHSVLLAALLRAAGIPSRVVGGLLYVEEFAGGREIFGYHMWTQALVDGRWLDLDATTPEPFDATHIALTASALGDEEGLLGASASLAAVMGTLRIEVLELQPGTAEL